MVIYWHSEIGVVITDMQTGEEQVLTKPLLKMIRERSCFHGLLEEVYFGLFAWEH